MTKETSIRLFEQKQVRSVWDSEKEAWYFSIIDVIEVLTGTDRSRKYWSDLKSKLKNEGSELSDKIGQLKMAAGDGKMRLTDVADTEQLFRLIQSIPSPKVEPFKLWLARMGRERIDEIEEKTGKKVVTKENARQLEQKKVRKIRSGFEEED